jgi:Zn finger protein HypA/HybF involved in hydrogenase expression
MLRQLLQLAADRGTANTHELALQLGVSTAMVSELIEELVSRGYLHAVVPGCSLACEQCPLHVACRRKDQARTWVLTSKGARTLAKIK